MQIVIGIIVGLLVLTLLVLAHEYGHFRAARRNGVRVNEFGIGFPPRAIGWIKKNGKWVKLPKSEYDRPQKSLILSINWLPIGGFCAMDGESDADTKKGTFGAASFWAKTKILFAGVTMNWLVAFIILTILAWTGMPHFLNNQFAVDTDDHVNIQAVTISTILADSPAQAAGLQPEDQITAVTAENKTVTITSADDVVAFNNQYAGQTVVYTISRSAQNGTIEIPIKLNTTEAEYLLGVTMSQAGQTLHYATWSAPIVGAATTIQLTGETFRGLGEMLWNLGSGIFSQFSFNDQTREEGRENIGKVGDSVSGPVGIIGMIFPAFTSAGPTNLAFLAALISVSLACMNVLPIPALDGGRWLLMAVFRLRRKKLTQETEARIVSRAFLILIALIVLITILDITRFFR